MKNKTKWELSALASSRSLDKRTTVESQINGLYLTSWCRHHNTVLGSKRCIRRTQCQQDALWRYGFLSACSWTGSTKIAPGLTFRWWIGVMHPVHQICIQERHCQVPSVARHLIGSDIILVGQRECISSEYISEGCLSRTQTVYLVILVQLILISRKLQSFVCGIHGRWLTRTNEPYMYKRGKPIRIMALLPTSQNLFMHILQAIML